MFKSTGLTFRLIFAFLGVSAVVLAVGILGLISVNNLDRISTHMDEVHQLNESLLLREVEHLTWAQTVMIDMNTKKSNIEVQKDPHKCNLGKWYYGEERKQFETIFPEIKELLMHLEQPHIEMHHSVEKLEQLIKDDNMAGAEKYLSEKTLVSLGEVQGIMKNLRNKLSDFLKKEAEGQNVFTHNAMLQGYIGMAAGVTLAILLGIFLSLSISRRINRNVQDLSQSANQLMLASGQVSTSSQNLSSGASELASSIEEMTSSLEELQSIIESNTKNINQSKMMTNDAGNSAEKSTTQMHEMMSAMAEIEGNNNRVAKIIKVIDDIAFQTNILALNAAVEAARAGDAGRGFAVVADQVKSLAQKSADAAKETAALIEGAIGSVSNGKLLSEAVRDSIVSVKEVLEKIRTMMDETDRASLEQLKGAGQITKAVSEINGVVQNTASTSEENAAAGEEMFTQAEMLKGIVENLRQIVSGARKGVKDKGIGNKLLTDKSADVQDVHLKKVSAVHTQHIALNNAAGVEIIRPEDKIPMDDFKDF
jgi:methyl-accepting chemotaxis protein